MQKWILSTVAAAALSFPLALIDDAHAQLSSRPFSFGQPGGVGMSTAGKQAIIHQKLFDHTPDAILKGPDGQLLRARRGPGRTAIVTGSGRGIVPSYRGRGLGGGLRAGEFNSFFVEFDGLPYHPHWDMTSTRATIDGWTGNVLHGAPIASGGSSVDQWTSMVYYLGYR